MKQAITLVLIFMLFLAMPLTVTGLYTPEVTERHGVLALRHVEDTGLILGGEFGLTDDLAIVADVGDEDYNRAALKYLLNPDLAVLGGVTDSNLFLGFDFGADLTDNIAGIAELDIYQLESKLTVDYELGLKYDLTQHLDIRCGLLGTVTETDTTRHFQLGMGYRY